MLPEVKHLRDKFQLIPHPEGGFFRETYRSAGVIPAHALPAFPGQRNYCTAIYFLLTSDNFSAFHRIRQDEVWHFYGGAPLHVHVLDAEGNYTCNEVGMDIGNGATPQLVVPAGCWFASDVKEPDSYSFVGCTVAPGFDFADFELAGRAELIEAHPRHSGIITRLTRG